MDKRSLHHLWTAIRRVRVWYLLVPLLVVVATSVYALRANNLRMVTLRDAVYTADKDNGDVEGALQGLRGYVYGHMNTQLSSGDNVYPPIQLKYTYQRLKDAEKARVQAETDKVYHDAQVYCEQQNPAGFSGRGRVPCVEDYVKSHRVAEKTIPDAMYKFDFVSPWWSPDLAGFSVLVGMALLLLLILRIIAGLVLRRMVR